MGCRRLVLVLGVVLGAGLSAFLHSLVAGHELLDSPVVLLVGEVVLGGFDAAEHAVGGLFCAGQSSDFGVGVVGAAAATVLICGCSAHWFPLWVLTCPCLRYAYFNSFSLVFIRFLGFCGVDVAELIVWLGVRKLGYVHGWCEEF